MKPASDELSENEKKILRFFRLLAFPILVLCVIVLLGVKLPFPGFDVFEERGEILQIILLLSCLYTILFRRSSKVAYGMSFLPAFIFLLIVFFLH
jgi:hypothetical protein